MNTNPSYSTTPKLPIDRVVMVIIETILFAFYSNLLCSGNIVLVVMFMSTLVLFSLLYAGSPQHRTSLSLFPTYSLNRSALLCTYLPSSLSLAHFLFSLHTSTSLSIKTPFRNDHASPLLFLTFNFYLAPSFLPFLFRCSPMW